MDDFFHARAKELVNGALISIESETSARVVVAVDQMAGDYRHPRFAGGLLFALGYLCLFLYFPEPFDYTYLPLEALIVFGLGTALASSLDPFKRFFLGARQKQRAVRLAACDAFVRLKMGDAPQKSAILVYVAGFERRAEVVCDVGIDAVALGAPLADAIKKIERSVRLDQDPQRFADALKCLGPVLATAFPKTPSDEEGEQDTLTSASESEALA